jgi:CDP-diacylglycerol--glycerol-3-phosphate 3-phosphatidyltransferase
VRAPAQALAVLALLFPGLPVLSSKARRAFSSVVEPVGQSLARAGVTANTLTVLGLAGSAAAGVLVGTGHLFWGGAVSLLAGLPDMLDGAVAKASGSAGPRGAFFDSVVDRLSDAAVLIGVVFWAAADGPPRVAPLAAGVLALSLAVSYVKARAQSLGFDCEVGIAERPERLIVLGAALVTGLVEPGLWLLLAATAITVGQRVVHVWRQAGVAS